MKIILLITILVVNFANASRRRSFNRRVNDLVGVLYEHTHHRDELGTYPHENLGYPTKEEMRSFAAELILKYPELGDSGYLKSFEFLPSINESAYTKMPYSEFVKYTDTGDLLLLSHDDRTSKLIRIGSRSPFSHVAMVYRNPELSTSPMLFQSTMAEIENVLTGEKKTGQQLNVMDNYMLAYQHKAIWRRLSVDKESRKQYAHEEMTAVIDLVNGLEYPPLMYVPINFIMGVLGWKKFGNPEDRYCSELVATIMIQQSYMCFKALPYSFSPGAFENGNRIEGEIFKIKYEDYLIDFSR